METLTQVFYNKFCQYPQGALQTKEVQVLIERAAQLIKDKEGPAEEKYFRNLMTINEAVDIFAKH